MTPVRGPSLFVKLFTTFVVIVVIAIAAAAWQAIRVGRETIQAMVVEDLAARAEVLNHDVEHYFSDRIKEVEDWAGLAVMDDLLIADRSLRIQNFLIGARLRNPGRFASLAVIDGDEVVVASTQLSEIGRSIPLSGFRATDDHGRAILVGTLRMASEDTVASVPLAVPIRSRLRTDAIGWLVAEIAWEQVDRIVSDAQVAGGPQGAARFVGMVDGTGRLVAGDRARFRSQGAATEAPGWNVPTTSERYLVARSDRIDHGPGAGFAMVAFRSKRDAYAPMRRFIGAVTASAVLGIVLAGGAAFLLARRFAQRIRRLTDGTGRLADGDLEYRVVDRSRDELGQLASSFNAMAVRLTDARGRVREEAARWRALAEYAPDIIVRLSPSADVEFINRPLPGYRVEDIIGTPVYRWIRDDYHGALRALLTAAMHRGEGGSLEAEGVGPHGAAAWYSIRVGPIRNQDRVEAVNLIATDITGKRRLERDILEVSEKERERMGRDLHDGLGQVLTGVSLLSRGLQNKLHGKDIAEASDAHRIDSLVQDAIEQTRQMARGLFPIGIAESGLRVALEDLAAAAQASSGVDCRVVGTPPDCCEEDRRAMHLYRIVQEAVNNALRHGKPENIAIRLFTDQDRCAVVVEDDGVGFPTSAPNGTGMGLRLMQYRASMVGAMLDVRRGPGGGTVLTCRFPPEVIDA